MTTQVPDGYLSNGARLVGEMQTAVETLQSILEETLGGSAEVGLTLATDIALVPNDSCQFTIDTEGFVASDNLMTLNGASPGVLRDGHVVMIRNFNAGRTVVVKHGTGNIQTHDARDITLSDTKTYVIFVYRGTTWYEICRADAAFIRSMIGAVQETDLGIVGDVVTATQGLHRVDTEALAPTDNLTNIIQTSMLTNLLLIRIVNAARVVTVVNGFGGAGQILTADGANIVLDSTSKFLFLMRKGTDWIEIDRMGFPAIGTHLRTLVSAGASSNAQSGFRTYIIDTTAIGGNHTLNLPSVAASTNSQITIKIIGDNYVEVDPQGAQLIEGTTTKRLQGDGAAFTLVEDGTQWRFI